MPSLKNNLISFRVLEYKGIIITFRDDLLKVVAGVLTVMKGTRRNNLYNFQGNIVIGLASIVSVKALQTLVKQVLVKGANSCKLKFVIIAFWASRQG